MPDPHVECLLYELFFANSSREVLPVALSIMTIIPVGFVYTESSVDTLLAVQACMQHLVPYVAAPPDGLAESYRSGNLCVSRSNTVNTLQSRLIHWAKSDFDDHFTIWRSRTSSNLLLKESHYVIGKLEYEVTSIFTKWDVVTRQLISFAEHPVYRSWIYPLCRTKLSRSEYVYRAIKVC